MKTNIIKSALTAIAAVAFVWLGTAPTADARPHSGRPSYESRVYVSGYCHCGRPIYTQRYFVGYGRHGRPIWGTREVNRHSHYRMPPRAHRPHPSPPSYHPGRPTPYPHSGYRR